MSEEHPLARRLDDGRILLRRFAREPDGTMIDGVVAIGPDDPEYGRWDAAITRWEHDPKPLDDSIDYEPIDYTNFPLLPDTHTRDRD